MIKDKGYFYDVKVKSPSQRLLFSKFITANNFVFVLKKFLNKFLLSSSFSKILHNFKKQI